jgi:methylmalonyl-CoA mutase
MTEKYPDFNFTVSSITDWLDAAQQELGENEPMEKLSRNKGSLKIKPYYDASTASQLEDFQQLPAINPFYGARSWMNTPLIKVADEKQANEAALAYLQSGADGILFEPVKANLRFGILLDQIKPEFCTLSFLIHSAYFQNAIDFKLWTEKRDDYKLLAGCLFWDDLSNLDFEQLKFSSQNFFPFGLLIPTQQNAEDEIVFGLEKAARFLELISDQKNVKQIINHFAFSLSIGTDLFLEIAKLKALRNLWYQIQGAYGIAEMKPLHIHARSTTWINQAFQPHGNMIKSTLSALSSIAGGCDSLTIEPEGNDQTENRIALNVSSILREESYLSKVADPTAGSYYLDSLVAALSEKAWQKFQIKMKK